MEDGSSQLFYAYFHTGLASAPAAISIGPAGFTGIYVNITIYQNEGSLCFDEYRANISGIETGVSNLSLVVLDVCQIVYSFLFPTELCRDLITGVYATALAVTNGMSRPTLTVPGPVDTLNRTSKFDFCAKSYIVIEYMYIIMYPPQTRRSHFNHLYNSAVHCIWHNVGIYE